MRRFFSKLCSIFFAMCLLSASNGFSQEIKSFKVYFDFNMASINARFINQIDSLILQLKIDSVYLDASCDTVGSIEFNYSLSLRRAESVKRFLTSKKLRVESIKVRAQGEQFAFESIQYLNRFVKVTFFSDNRGLTENFIPENISKLTVGSNLKIPNLNFYPGKHKLLPGSYKTLEKLVLILEKNKGVEIELGGHICCLSDQEVDGYDDDTQTNDLSVNRAKEVYDFLILNGIEKKRLSYKGYGASKKIVKEDSEKTRSINRRVEIQIMKNNMK